MSPHRLTHVGLYMPHASIYTIAGIAPINLMFKMASPPRTPIKSCARIIYQSPSKLPVRINTPVKAYTKSTHSLTGDICVLCSCNIPEPRNRIKLCKNVVTRTSVGDEVEQSLGITLPLGNMLPFKVL